MRFLYFIFIVLCLFGLSDASKGRKTVTQHSGNYIKAAMLVDIPNHQSQEIILKSHCTGDNLKISIFLTSYSNDGKTI